MNEIYNEVSEKIIKSLESGLAPWQRPWNFSSCPKNFSTGNHYSGFNIFILINEGFVSNQWGTAKQIFEKGGRIKKGEKHTKIIFWKFKKVAKIDKNGEILEEEIPLLRCHQVFNIEQTTGLEKYLEPVEKSLEFCPIDNAEKIINDFKNAPRIIKQGSSAFYSQLGDFVNIPDKSHFISIEEFYCTLFHELGHSTGHPKRLNRFNEISKVHSKKEEYSREELIAEFSSSFLMAEAGIFTKAIEKNSASYIKGWSKFLREDKFSLVTCSKEAQKVSNYILGRHASLINIDQAE